MALVLTLEDEDIIFIGKEITILVYRKKGRFRLVIEAPRDIKIDRTNAQKKKELTK